MHIGRLAPTRNRFVAFLGAPLPRASHAAACGREPATQAQPASKLCYDDASAIVSGQPVMPQTFDRAAEDLGNSIHLEHVNVQIPDQRLAALFYAAGVGLTRDPAMMVGDGNMWINVGRSQFHLPNSR